MVDVAVSEASRQKAAAAKSYIENMYRVHAQKHQDRRERCSPVSPMQHEALYVCSVSHSAARSTCQT